MAPINKKQEILREIKHSLLIAIGSIILSFSTAIFLTKNNIIAGGVAGVGIIIQYFVGETQVVDIAVAVITWTLWLVGLIFIGKSFAIKTLIASIVYPVMLSVFLRFPIFDTVAINISGGENSTVGNLILCALFGGILNGAGVAITFIGGGSTGGFDVVMALLEKYFKVKESLTSLIIDISVVVTGLVVFIVNNEDLVPSLCGIMCAIVIAFMIDYVYLGAQRSYQVDIISDKWEIISYYVQEDLGRGCTIIPAKGGYKGEERIILRVVFDKKQYRKLRDFISKTDPKAFITFTTTNAVYGEGFKTNSNLEELSKEIKLYKKEKKKNDK